MYSKVWKSFSWLVLVLVPVALNGTGCDRYLRSSRSEEQKQKSRVIEVKPADLQCLKELPDQIELYLKDQAEPQTLEDAFLCMDKGLQSFMRLYQGNRPDHYLDHELRDFFNRYLLPENKIRETFMDEIMKLKVLLVGGTAQELTRTELEKISQLLVIFKEEGLRLRGSMRYFLFNEVARKPNERTPEETARLQDQLKGSVTRVIQQSKAVGSLYEFTDLRTFLSELSDFIGDDSEGFEKINEWIPLVDSVKGVFWGATTQLESQRDWLDSALWTLDGYFLALDYYYQVSDRSILDLSLWERLISLMDRGLYLIEEAPILRNGGRLEVKAIDRALTEVWGMKNFKPAFPVETIQKTYKMAILRVFDRNQERRAIPLDSVSGIERKHLRVLRFEFNVWRLAQEMIMDTFKGRPMIPGRPHYEILAAAQGFDVKSRMSQLRDANEGNELLLESVQDWIHLLEQNPPLVWTSQKKIRMEPGQVFSQNSFIGLTWMNALRTAARLTLRGYGEGQHASVFQLKVSEDALAHLEEDFREMGRALGMLDPRSSNSARRTFKEANFFTYHADGDEGLNGLEILEELGFMISGGRVSTKEIYDSALHEAGCGVRARDALKKQLLRRECFEKFVIPRLANSIDNLPGMRVEYNSLTQKGKEEFLQSLLDLAAQGTGGESYIEWVDIRNTFVLLHYVESLMLIFDTNTNGALDEFELKRAAPRFRSFIRSLNPLKDYLVDDIFLCLVYNGRKPGVADLAKFKLKQRLGNLGEVRRAQLIRVMSVLKTDASKK